MDLLKCFQESVRAFLECTRRVRARAGLLRETIALRMVRLKKVFTATLERASCGIFFAGARSSVCYISVGALLRAKSVHGFGEADNLVMNRAPRTENPSPLAGTTSRGGEL